MQTFSDPGIKTQSSHHLISPKNPPCESVEWSWAEVKNSSIVCFWRGAVWGLRANTSVDMKGKLTLRALNGAFRKLHSWSWRKWILREANRPERAQVRRLNPQPASCLKLYSEEHLQFSDHADAQTSKMHVNHGGNWSMATFWSETTSDVRPGWACNRTLMFLSGQLEARLSPGGCSAVLCINAISLFSNISSLPWCQFIP